MRALKPFRRPRLWFGLWCFAVVLVITLSLAPPAPLPDLPSGSDKVEHALAYFLLSAGAVQIFAGRGVHVMVAIALVMLGIGLEFAQGAFTTDRMQDPWDALANALGVVIGLATSWMPWRSLLLKLDR